MIVLYAHDRLYDARPLSKWLGEVVDQAAIPGAWFMAAEATSAFGWAIKI